eukprot:15009-Prorocentrum_minimum.AAC.1
MNTAPLTAPAIADIIRPRPPLLLLLAPDISSWVGVFGGCGGGRARGRARGGRARGGRARGRLCGRAREGEVVPVGGVEHSHFAAVLLEVGLWDGSLHRLQEG